MSRREFHCTEGGSRKFWAVAIAGTRMTVQFGRIGATGQTNVKEFPSNPEASSAAERLIAEKLRKGYVEVSAAAGTSTATSATPAPTQAVPPPASSTPASVPVVTREVAVEPPPWVLPLSRRVQKPRPALAPFDLEACRQRVRDALDAKRHYWNLAPIAPLLTPQEAHFWLLVLDAWAGGQKNANAILARVEGVDLAKTPSCQEVLQFLSASPQPYFLQRAALNLLTPDEVIDLVADGAAGLKRHSEDFCRCCTGEFLEHQLPYLSQGEIESMQERLRDHLRKLSPGRYAWVLAAYLELHPELESYVETALLSTHGYGIEYHLIFNLAEPAAVIHHTRRLGLKLSHPDYVKGWLYRTGVQGLDLVREGVLASSSKNDAESLLKVLCCVRTPEAAPFLLELQSSARSPGPANKWLSEQVGNAVAGLLPVAGGRGKLADAAVDYLRGVKRRGLGFFIEEQLRLAALPDDVAARVRREVLDHEEKVYPPFDAATTPAWLEDAPTSAGPKLPDWADPVGLPPLVAGERCLTPEQRQGVLGELRKRPLTDPGPFLTSLKSNLDRESLDSFAWKLFERWIAGGAPSKEKWAFSALGLLGGDGIALKLAPLIREWPGENQHPRAVHGLECLRAIGTDGALTQLNGIAQKVKFAGLKKKAQEFMEAIAQQRGFSREQLEDRIVPDLGLDERGTRVFDFGPRQFRVVIGPDLKPMVREEGGKVRADLPAPNSKDDESKASAAVAEWKLLKKQLREVVKVQAQRLEQALVSGRRWPVAEFESFLVRHPLQTNLVQRLLWAAHDAEGKLLFSFRVTAEGTCADVGDNAVSLARAAAVGLVHPLHLSEAERSGWGQVFGDYELIPPFPQLARPVYGLEPGEEKAQYLTRWAACKVPGVSVAGTLEKAGWVRGELHDHGDFHEYSRHFPSAGVKAVVEVEPGLWASNKSDTEAQSFPHVYFLRGQDRVGWHATDSALPLSGIDPVVLSEVLAEMTALGAKEEK